MLRKSTPHCLGLLAVRKPSFVKFCYCKTATHFDFLTWTAFRSLLLTPALPKSALPTIRLLGCRHLTCLRVLLRKRSPHRLGFASCSQSVVFGTTYLSTSSVRYPNFALLNTSANPLCRQSAFLSLELSFFPTYFEKFASNSDWV